LAAGLRAAGVTPGMRVVLLVRPGLTFLPLTFALFRIGAVPVLIDPGMGRRNLLGCIERMAPEGLIGVPLVHLIRLVRRRAFRTVQIAVTVGWQGPWGGYDIADLKRLGADGDTSLAVCERDSAAAIIFTTGSTGPPKGVAYTHGMFGAQTDLLQRTFDMQPDDVDMPGFALFALFSAAIGMTVVLPDMDPTRPAEVNPDSIITAATRYGATFSFGSPALWNRVSRHCQDTGTRLPTLKRVLMAGAPIAPDLHERMLGHVLADGADVHTPYGATENLPVTSFSGTTVLAETWERTGAGQGYCVGAPLRDIELRIIEISDGPLPDWSVARELEPGTIGEVVVRGPVVSRHYVNQPEQTALHKIYDSADHEHGTFWHRIGDLGYRDAEGRLWFCGRKAHRVETADSVLYTVCCEAVFNTHPRVFRSALVGLGERPRQRPVIIVEPEAGAFPADARDEQQLREELRAIGASNSRTAKITDIRFHRSFPVDIRHNAKIFREQLAAWAAATG
jgi:acyl-CoA synthetase (AMP-forming)/AMP-acid ligase II